MCDPHSCGQAQFVLLHLHRIPNRSRCGGQIFAPKIISSISKRPLKAINKKTINVSFTGSDTIRLADQCTRFRDNWKSACSQSRTTIHDYVVLHTMYLAYSISLLGRLLNTRLQRSVYVCDASRSAEVNESGFRAVRV